MKPEVLSLERKRLRGHVVSSNIQKRKKFSIVSEITGMVTSRQMAAPLFNNRMGDPGRRSICQGYCRHDWSWERKWTPWTLPWQLFPLQICMLHAGPQGAYWSLVIPLTLIPQGYKSSLRSHNTASCYVTPLCSTYAIALTITRG